MTEEEKLDAGLYFLEYKKGMAPAIPLRFLHPGERPDRAHGVCDPGAAVGALKLTGRQDASAVWAVGAGASW